MRSEVSAGTSVGSVKVPTALNLICFSYSNYVSSNSHATPLCFGTEQIIQVPDMEYSMFQNLHSFYMGYAMNCANAYLSHGGFNGPSCNSEV